MLSFQSTLLNYSLRKYEGNQICEWPEVEYSPMPGLPPIRVEATTCALGHEKELESYIGHLVAIYRQVYRVLREDGCVFIVMGDSYSGSGKGQLADGTHAAKHGEKQHTSKGTLTGGLSTSDIGLKQGDLMLVPHRLALALQADGWVVRNDLVWKKCLSGGAIVYAQTQKGEMPMTVKDMVRLDPSTVKLWDGEKWNQCIAFEEETPHPDRKKLSEKRRTHKYYTGEELPVMGDIEIELRNGQRIGCTRDHKWPIEGLGLLVKAEDLKIGHVLKSTTLPEPEQPRMPSALDDDDIGWFVGMYIAEGHTYKSKIGISSHIKEQARLKRLGRIATAYDGYVWFQNTGENGMVIFVESPVLRGILSAYISGKKAHGKHLNVRCWKRSNKFLDAVLKGYLEGDGGRQGDRWKLGFTQNDALAADLRTLASRLGYSLRLKRCVHKLYEQKFPGWRGSLYFDPNRRKQPDTQIVAIRQSRARKFWNIALKDEPHLFALTCGVLTCNSAPMPESVRGQSWQKHRIKVKGCSAPNKQGVRGTNMNGGWTQDTHPETRQPAQYVDCPGCEKCEANDGYILKRGSWRHTRAHEMVIMCTKKMGYWADQEKVREGYSEKGLNDAIHAYGYGEGSKMHQLIQEGAHGNGGLNDPTITRDKFYRHGGRNPRSVLSPSPEPFSGAHFAVFPTGLIEPLIKATCPTKCCPECGAGWSPVVEKGEGDWEKRKAKGAVGGTLEIGHNSTHGHNTDHTLGQRKTNILGYRPTCGCGMAAYDAVPGVVLDPFGGSGTTALVADRLGLSAVLIEISRDYAEMAKERIEADAPLLTNVEIVGAGKDE